MNQSRRQVLRLISAAPALLVRPARAKMTLDARNPIAAYGQTVNYGIYRNNKSIGKHTLQFANDAERLSVQIESNIVVTVLKVPVYRFNYRSTEAWTDGQLQGIEATTNDNGKQHQVSAKRVGPGMVLTDKEGNTATATVDYASNHWNPQVLSSDKLFNTLTGKTNTIVLQDLGTDNVTINNDAIDAKHYRLAGKLKTDVWYDNIGRWVQLRFNGEDGSVVEYRCKGFKL